ncbi:MAG: SPOR domain-containing protein [Parahaliea sp.]
MARDYAKRGNGGGRNTPRRSAATRQPAAPTGSNRARLGRAYGAGVLTGILVSLALYLVTLPPAPDDTGTTAEATAKPDERDQTPPKEPATPKPRFDFYTMLPEQTVDVDVEPAEMAQRRSSTANGEAPKEVYLLQAGSFRQSADADRRRAELLLLGLEPRVEESSGDNGRWFRVFLGPFDSHSKMARARSLTASQDIDTLLLKREG